MGRVLSLRILCSGYNELEKGTIMLNSIKLHAYAMTLNICANHWDSPVARGVALSTLRRSRDLLNDAGRPGQAGRCEAMMTAITTL
nr:MAG TPA: hypothetical protein [Caudoviricetes sp.]